MTSCTIVLLSSLCAVSLLLLLLLKPRRSCTVRVIFYESINLGGGGWGLRVLLSYPFILFF